MMHLDDSHGEKWVLKKYEEFQAADAAKVTAIGCKYVVELVVWRRYRKWFQM